MCHKVEYGRMLMSEVVENKKGKEGEGVTWLVEAYDLGNQGAPVAG